ncbi:MAG: hypothetical protein P0Y53_15025 [Candidatus Pseudobacter hemicellulosilyticus]|uniref:Outer membrane protein beta-barrel domain-containing protein n=1 Tax=Candidatus Pseudobacter hemicellulosilyticus TaxID=3121375 RepID=A0AAJ5WNU3_9BACT|nr:MAG: hypothetical protein P0Y53_15025 [Pseudobacter sp.]
MKWLPALILAALFLPRTLEAQDTETTQSPGHASIKGLHRITLSIGHSHIRKGLRHDETYGVSAASWALDYDYWLTDHWAVGVHSDLLLENFLVEEHIGNKDEETSIMERNYPISVIPVILYKPWEHLALVAGVGEEFSKEENLLVYRGGLELGWHLPHHWELGATFNYDVKKDAYDTWMVGFGVSRFLGGHHAHHEAVHM